MGRETKNIPYPLFDVNKTASKKKGFDIFCFKRPQTFECSMSGLCINTVLYCNRKKMNTSTVSIKYAKMKAVQRFFGTHATAIQMPSSKELKAAGDDGKLFSLVLLKFLAEGEVGKEFVSKPTFSFGRCIIKFSKNAAKFALNQLVIYLTEYTYEATGEKRVQIVIAPPTTNDEFDEFADDLDNLDDLMGQTPAAAVADDNDEDDADEDDEDAEEEEEEEEAPKAKSRKK